MVLLIQSRLFLNSQFRPPPLRCLVLLSSSGVSNETRLPHPDAAAAGTQLSPGDAAFHSTTLIPFHHLLHPTASIAHCLRIDYFTHKTFLPFSPPQIQNNLQPRPPGPPSRERRRSLSHSPHLTSPDLTSSLSACHFALQKPSDTPRRLPRRFSGRIKAAEELCRRREKGARESRGDDVSGRGARAGEMRGARCFGSGSWAS